MQRPVVYRARKLRTEMSLPEAMLWQQLRLRPMGLKFRRQHPIGAYVVDFCCLSARLAIEVDGIVHDMGDRPKMDARRDSFIREKGYRVLRVSAKRVMEDAVTTAAAIAASAANPLHRPADGPPPRAGED
ncbi:MAG: endonuclease domain-containing protein [Novosphingobium sp.]